MPEKLRPFLNRLYSTYKREYLETDPVCLPHIFRDTNDIEIAALLAALFAFGRAEIIIRSVRSILQTMKMRPRAYVVRSSSEKIIADFSNFKYRFVNGADLSALLLGLRSILLKHKSLSEFMRNSKNNTPYPNRSRHPLISEKTWQLCLILRQALYGAGIKAAERNGIKTGQGLSHLLADPLKTSALKRWFLFFRWMVRSDEIDFGIWKFITPHDLLMPVDTHIARIGGLIGLTKKKTAGAAMVKEITYLLREVNPEDPLKYDFALTRLGILGECPKKRINKLCRRCVIEKICLAGLRPET